MTTIMVRFAPRLTGGSTLTGTDRLEVSLPCCNCRRNHRTIMFCKLGEEQGICTPTEKCRGFPGSWVDFSLDEKRLSYQIECQYTPFTDAKNGGDSTFAMPWARINFHIRCGACGFISLKSDQTNVVRPHDILCGKCSAVVIADEVDPIAIEVTS
jgi:hypothetical protein